jgi:hypothetical protein
MADELVLLLLGIQRFFKTYAIPFATVTGVRSSCDTLARKSAWRSSSIGADH